MILPPSIALYDNLAAFDLCMKQWVDDLKTEVLLVYSIDQVDEKALPLLAEQFDVLGYKGMRLAQTVPDQRALIKRAIELHRYKGTLWAVREAIKSVGFTDVEITEHVNGNWANFSVRLLNTGVGITVDSIADMRKMIEEYKNVRSNLVDVFMDSLIEETIEFNDDDVQLVEDLLADDSLIMSGGLFYDGTADYDGSHDHSGDSDEMIWVAL